MRASMKTQQPRYCQSCMFPVREFRGRDVKRVHASGSVCVCLNGAWLYPFKTELQSRAQHDPCPAASACVSQRNRDERASDGITTEHRQEPRFHGHHGVSVTFRRLAFFGCLKRSDSDLRETTEPLSAQPVRNLPADSKLPTYA